MSVIGYTPHPSGGFTFHRDDGAPMMFVGPEANGLAQWLDATRGPDARLAYDPSAPFGTAASVPDAEPGAPPTASDANMSMAPSPAPAMSAAMPPRALSPNAGLVEMQSGPARREAPAAPASSEQPIRPVEGVGAPAGEGPIFTGPDVAAYALGKVHVPGRAAYNPAADAASRSPVPVSRTVTGGLGGTPEEEKQRAEDAQAYRDANKAAVEQAEAASAERIAAAEDQRRNALNNVIQAEQEQRDAVKRAAAVQNTWDTTNARLQTERDAAAQQRVDPNRLFHEKGTAAAIGSALAVGLGAFGASLSKTPNYAQQIVEASIQRDIDAQVDAIHRRQGAAQNAIADFQRTYGLDLQESKLAVKASQLRYAASMADINAARLTSADAKQGAAVLKANLLGNAMKSEAELAELYKGRQTTNFAMASPVKASGGYDREPTAKEVKERAEAAGAVNKAGGSGKPSIQEQRLQLRMDEDERSRRVATPWGDMWATKPEIADKAKDAIKGGMEVKSNLRRMEEILSKPGESMDPELRAEYSALADKVQALSKDVHGFRTLTEGDMEMMHNLTGAGGERFLSLKDATRKRLQVANQDVDYFIRKGIEDLYTEPDAGVDKHYKKSETQAGIKVNPRKRVISGNDEGGGGGEEGGD